MAPSKKITIGIQGGRGSFNELACLTHMEEKNVADYEIEYLHTTEKVLQALTDRSIEIGQFAVHNVVGGIVDESYEAMGRFLFSPQESFTISISHHFMVHPDASLEEIKTFMTHPQVYRQCEKNLKKSYPHIQQSVGENDMIDSSRVGEAIAKGEVPRSVAVLGNERIAQAYGLKLIASHLEDNTANQTTFLWVTRK